MVNNGVVLMILYRINFGINFPDTINYLFDRDFHSSMQIAYVNSFLQLLAEMVACIPYRINANIIAPLLVGLFCGLWCFLQHHYKIDSMHLINSATNYSRCKCDIVLEMIVRINFQI